MEKKIKNDEIDLMTVVLSTINIFRANFWLILSFFLVGILIGIGHYYSSRKVYENKMVISSTILTKSYGKILIDNVNRYRKDGDVTSIARILNTTEETAAQILFLQIESVVAVDQSKDSERFIITAEVFEPKIFPELQRGIIYYMENNEFAKVRVKQNENYYKQMIAKVDLEIKDMEEFKKRIFQGNFFENIKGNVMFDPTSVNSKILELTKERITLQNALELVRSVQIIEGFSNVGSPTKPKLFVSMASGASIGLVLVGALIVFKSIRKLLRMADAAKQSSS